MTNAEEIERIFNTYSGVENLKESEFSTHQTLYAQFKAFAHYIDQYTPEGDEKDSGMNLLKQASDLFHQALDIPDLEPPKMEEIDTPTLEENPNG